MNLGIWVLALSIFSSGASAEIVDLKLKSGRVLKADIRDTGPRQKTGKPVMLVFGGFQNAGHVLDLVHPTVPMILASFDYPYDPPRKVEFPDGMKLAPVAKRTIHETSEGIELLVAHLKKRKDVEPAKMTIVGASLGAPFAAIAGANISDLKGVVIVHGFGKVAEVITHQLLTKWQKKYGALAKPMATWIGTWAWQFIDIESPEHALERLQNSQRVLMIQAENDTFVPKEASDALWKAIERSKARKKKITHPGDHLQPGSNALISNILQMIQAWAKDENLL